MPLEQSHTRRGDAVAGEEAEDRRRELKRHGERENAKGDLLPLRPLNPAELEPRHDECCRGETEEAEREWPGNRPQRDPGAQAAPLSRLSVSVGVSLIPRRAPVARLS